MKVHFSFSKLKKQAFFSKNAVEKCFLLENKKTTFFAKNVVEKRGPRPPLPPSDAHCGGYLWPSKRCF